ncbi:hypothetical protein Tco_0605567 [Tanacetum coccineum]
MIGCKVMRTLAIVEIDIMLILGLPCCLSSSSVRCLENVGKFVAGFLDGTDTESEPFEDPVKTETLESLHTVAPPTSLPKSTSFTLVPILCKIARMAVRVSPAMLPSLSASMAEVETMSESAFHKRFRSSHESLFSSSSPNLPLQNRYRGTSELVEDDEEDDDEKDGDIEENFDSDSVSEDVEDEGPTTKDEDPAAGDEGLTTGDEGPREEDVVVPEGQQQAAPVMGTAMSEQPFKDWVWGR